eukprot:CAMPEP_0202919474 /NCGR_PEP_ID=MMETSP1392-20130828/75927_1 /ASSEMBLY_ACC=CAM_ASM_000868 /TAXON_ID=225041 /ORGANISM="Chlamydomonas chlamydogama, Strain SAG 11-48b" /LENGTH=146 /DNA_ID=CAMNT_0049612845 /DNA_START=7 /DNA_END=444 /DNA_ORIENTATION=+
MENAQFRNTAQVFVEAESPNASATSNAQVASARCIMDEDPTQSSKLQPFADVGTFEDMEELHAGYLQEPRLMGTRRTRQNAPPPQNAPTWKDDVRTRKDFHRELKLRTIEDRQPSLLNAPNQDDKSAHKGLSCGSLSSLTIGMIAS